MTGSTPPVAGRFAGRVALVTGGSRGIGRAIALRLAREGADVAIGFYRGRPEADRTVDDIRSLGRRAVAVKGNVGFVDKPAGLVSSVQDALGAPTIVISNAASGPVKPLMDTTERNWAWAQDVNCRPLLLLAQSARPGMAAAGGGSIVALSSLGSTRVVPDYGAIGVAKAALESLVRYLAVELASDGVRVNAVSPGAVWTDALRAFPGKIDSIDEALRRTPAGRLVEPDDVAGLVAFLCSDEAAMVRGQVLVIDGGYSLVI